ncbi:hypothetical protein GCM10009720_09020 [Yaniella flava]|uniref:Uncharacterized protein n=1 Tax=Yaniella flava TaxID=287930 RepID=A0ABN2U8S9_9MICC
MCRSIADGGRRCPSSDPAYRAAYRKARRAANDARASVIGEGGTFEIPADHVWEPAQLNAVAQDISLLTDHRHHNQSYAQLLNHVTEENRERYEEMYGKAAVDAALRLKDQMGKDTVTEAAEAAVIQVGYTVATEAEQRAGVSVGRLPAQGELFRIQTNEALDELGAELEDIVEQQRGLEASAHDVFNRAVKNREHMMKTYGANSYDAQQAQKQVDQARKELTDAKYSDEMLALNTRSNQLRSKQGELRRDLARGFYEEDQSESLTKLSDAYVETLSELRDLGGDTTWSDRTTKKSAAAFQQVAEIYPSEWIYQHNAGPDVYARISKRRAHYADRRLLEKKKRVRSQKVKLFDSEEDFENSSFGKGGYDDGTRTWREATEEELEGAGAAPFQTVMVEEHWQVQRMRHGGDVSHSNRPKGNHWEMYYTDNGRGDLVWRRPQNRMETVEAEVAPEITTNPATHSGNDPAQRGDSSHGVAFSTTAHEMSHRFEKVVPGIGDMEEAFLKRRTTHENGQREDLIDLYPGNGVREVARPDNFVTSYIGKEYGRKNAHEVLSVGVEAVFSGKYGGLVGAGRYEADTDHRAFVLGAMATIGQKQTAADTGAAETEQREPVAV